MVCGHLENVPCLTYSCQLLSAPGLDFVRSWAHQSDPLCTVRFPLLYSRSASQTWARRKTETCPEKFLCTTLAKFFVRSRPGHNTPPAVMACRMLQSWYSDRQKAPPFMDPQIRRWLIALAIGITLFVIGMAMSFLHLV